MNQQAVAHSLSIDKHGKLWRGRFACMASPCEVLLESASREDAAALIELAETEAQRIEQKFSRYRDDNIVFRINHDGGCIEVDEETARLLDFAQNCYDLSDGWFDITSGILRKAWHFDEGSKVPQQSEIEDLLPLIGWHKLSWEKPFLEIPRGMEVDFGGIGKEYAVDSAARLLANNTDASFMINFGGDCHANGPQADGSAWLTGIEDPHRPGDATAVIQLARGALATSGDVFKFIPHQGKRYGHILNPQTGWPNPDSPLSVTVAAPTCTEAGILSTLAMLQGLDAESFLQKQAVQFWCYR